MKRIKKALSDLFLAYALLGALYGMGRFWMSLGRALVDFRKSRSE